MLTSKGNTEVARSLSRFDFGGSGGRVETIEEE